MAHGWRTAPVGAPDLTMLRPTSTSHHSYRAAEADNLSYTALGFDTNLVRSVSDSTLPSRSRQGIVHVIGPSGFDAPGNDDRLRR